MVFMQRAEPKCLSRVRCHTSARSVTVEAELTREADNHGGMMKLKVVVAALAAGSSLLFAPMAGAAPNQHAVDNANDHAQTGLSVAAAAAPNNNAQTRGQSVAAVAGDGAAAVLDAVAAFAPDAAQTGLARAQCVAAGVCEP